MEYFVIAIKKSDGSTKYFSDDEYGSWSTSLGHATFYKSKEDAIQKTNCSDFTKEQIMYSGTKYGPYLLNKALEISYANPKDSGTLYILRIDTDLVNSVWEKEVECEIKEPKAVHYEY